MIPTPRTAPARLPAYEVPSVRLSLPLPTRRCICVGNGARSEIKLPSSPGLHKTGSRTRQALVCDPVRRQVGYGRKCRHYAALRRSW